MNLINRKSWPKSCCHHVDDVEIAIPVMRRYYKTDSLMTSCFCVFVCEAKVIPVYDGSPDLLSVVLEETGGLGVDIVIDSGGKHMYM